jgi:cytochrome c553
MTTRRTNTQAAPSSTVSSGSAPAATPAVSAAGPKLRQTQAEYTAARPNAEPGVKPMMSSSKMYVCIKCHANFKTGDGKPDPRLRGLGRCNNCLGVAAANATTPSPTA